jgi:CRISPR-associated endonuclease/helicase Cas3
MSQNTDTDQPADRYYIGGAGLPSTDPAHLFPFPEARRFQRIALDWIHDGSDNAPVSALAAPTGGGKTAVIAALADAAESGAVCTYPTNALIDAQTTALREVQGYDLDVESVTGQSLSGTGEERSQELLEIARSSGDVVVTNPDVLQAMIQGLYFSPGDRIFTFFEQFDAAVFDEFHYYDPLAASGLLMQIRVLAQRGQYLDREGRKRLPRVLLTSATPDEQFVDAVTEDFGIDAQLIRSRLVSLDLADPAPERVPPPDVDLLYDPAGATTDLPSRLDQLSMERPNPAALVGSLPAGVSRFRYPMVVNRWSTPIGRSFGDIAATLADTRDGWAPGDDPVAAVVFNSAARSNEFDTFLHESWEDLAAVTRKDNGYDTRAEGEDATLGEYAVLNTTSKGEVGLDFDLERLVVATPRTATAFIQRVGRAARQSPATIDVYGLDDPTWPMVQSYAGFLARVLDRLPNPATSRTRLRELAGLRAGRAIQRRFDEEMYYPDIETEFEDLPGHKRWHAFLRALADAEEAVGATLGGPTLDASGRRAVQGAKRAIKGLDSLRGRSVQSRIAFPVGDGRQITEYDVGRALRHYSIEGVDEDGTLQLGSGTPTGALTATYPGNPLGGVDLRQSDWTIEEQLTDAYRSAAGAADFREVDLDNDVLEWFFGVIPLQRALLPDTLDTDRYRLTIDQAFGEVQAVDDRRRD